jgi:uncharacterized protein YjbI with pentapeptide repeats
MRTDATVTVALAGLTLVGAVWAEDAGFRFNEESGRCEKEGAPGLNPGFVGECGDLSRVYLFGENLRGKNLRGAVFARADLAHADLSGADLRGASLAGAYLYRADLSGADLRDAVFSTRLGRAQLYRVRLEGAVFDACTVLPFSPGDALARRMVLVAHAAKMVSG